MSPVTGTRNLVCQMAATRDIRKVSNRLNGIEIALVACILLLLGSPVGASTDDVRDSKNVELQSCVGMTAANRPSNLILLCGDGSLSLASLKGPPRCQLHGTTSRPLQPADVMIPAVGRAVKCAGAGASLAKGQVALHRWSASRFDGRTRPR